MKNHDGWLNSTNALLGAQLFLAPGSPGDSGNAAGWPLVQTVGFCVAAVLLLGLLVVTVARVLHASTGLRYAKRKPAGAGGAFEKTIIGPREVEKPADPERLSQHIVERSEQIHRALCKEPSEIEVEMCLLGYRACVDDMITLGLLVEEELPGAGSLKRAKLKGVRQRAFGTLRHTREAFPPGVLCARHRERS